MKKIYVHFFKVFPKPKNQYFRYPISNTNCRPKISDLQAFLNIVYIIIEMWGAEIEIRTLGLLKSDFSLYKTNINYDFSLKEEIYTKKSECLRTNGPQTNCVPQLEDFVCGQCFPATSCTSAQIGSSSPNQSWNEQFDVRELFGFW